MLHGLVEWVPFDVIAERSPYGRFDTMHFSCGGLGGNEGYPRTSETFDPPEKRSVLRDPQCFDPVNYSLARLIFSVMYTKFAMEFDARGRK